MKTREPKILEGVSITEMSSEGKGIAKIDGKVYFVRGAVPEDVVDIRVKKSKSSYAEGEIHQLLSPSSLRIQPTCEHFGTCGGCKWQHIGYSTQLAYKTKIVEDAFNRIGKLDVKNINPILGCDDSFFYRNKLEFGFTDRKWLTLEEINGGAEFDRRGVGFHVPESFSGVLDIQKCWLQGGDSNAIRNKVRQFAIANDYTFFDLKNQGGFLRNLIVRTSSIGETMVLLSVTEDDKEKISAIMQFILREFPSINSLQYLVNKKRNDTIYDQEPIVFHGKDHIIEQLGRYQFKINPKSFFQTNTAQAEKLYAVTKEYAQLTGSENVFDLYTGVGSIALYVSDACKTVTGIEQIEAAIVDAKENARLNNVNNTTFYAGDVRMLLNQEFIAKHGKADVVITDPPRAGMHDDVVKTLLELESKRMVYVSCNPATQARDLQLLSEKYCVSAIQPVDMFPQTTHIENVVQLDLIPK